MRRIGSGDRVPSYDRYDLRIAHRFKLDQAAAEIAAGVQNIGERYADFDDTNIIKSRSYLSFSVKF
jgi:hypothetical protein